MENRALETCVHYSSFRRRSRTNSSCSCSSFDSPLWFREQTCDGSRDECALMSRDGPSLSSRCESPEKKKARFVLYVNASRINVTNERTQLGTTRREWRRKNERDRPVRNLTLQNYNYGTTTARRRTRTERPFSISSISDAFSSKNVSE